MSSQNPQWFKTSTEIKTTVHSASKNSLEFSLESFHKTRVSVKGRGFGKAIALNGLLYFNQWKDFLDRPVRADVYIGAERFRVWFTLNGVPVAFYEGEASGAGTFTGEGETTWNY